MMLFRSIALCIPVLAVSAAMIGGTILLMEYPRIRYRMSSEPKTYTTVYVDDVRVRLRNEIWEYEWMAVADFERKR